MKKYLFCVTATPKLEYDNKFQDLISLNSGSSLRIPVSVSGIPKPNVTWGKDDQPLKSYGRITIDVTEKSAVLHIKKVTRDDDGLYYIFAENEVGETKATFDVEVIGMFVYF